MRLREIEIENFGVFRGYKLCLGDGKLHLVCGPNEAGKSTLLQLIREVLFGFAVRNPYAFDDITGEMAATAVVEMADGSRVRFRRRKGNRNTVVGEVEGTGEKIDEAALSRLLGNATAELYKQVFGFSLVELASGEGSLKNASLQEALYGGGMGGLANLQRIQENIQQEGGSLFSPTRTAKKPEINRFLDQISQKTTELGQAMLKPRDYKERCQRRDETRARAEELRERRDACYRRTQHLARLAEAHPLWLQLTAAQQEASQLDVPERFPADGGQEFLRLREQWNQIGQDLADAENELRETQGELDRIRLTPELLDKEPEIKRIYRMVAQAESCHEDIPKLRQEAETIRATVRTKLTELNPQWDLPCLEQFRTSLAQRDRVEQMAEEAQQLTMRTNELARRKQEKTAKLVADRRELGRLRTVQPAPVLENVCQRAGQYRADQETCDTITRNLAKQAEQIARLETRLASPFGIPASTLATLPIPLESTHQEFARQFSEGTEALKSQTRDRDKAQEDLTDRQEELAQLDAEQSVPDRQELIAQRDRRDVGWRLIRRKYVEGEEPKDEISVWLGDRPASLPDQYEQEVDAADCLADDRQDKAELAAKHDQLTIEVARKQRRLEDLERKRATCEAQLHELEQTWHGLWAGCGLRPQSPEAMLEWLRFHSRYLEELDQRSELERRLRQVQDRIKAFESDLRTALGGEKGPTEMLLLRAQDLVKTAREAATLRDRYEAEFPTCEQDLSDLEKELEEVGRQREAWNNDWQGLLHELGFPADWDVRVAVKILNGLAETRQAYELVPDREARVTKMMEFVSAFESEVAQLCRLVAADLERLPTVEAAGQLSDRLQKAKNAQEQHLTLLAQRDRIQERVAAKRAQWERIGKRLEELRKAAGAESDGTFLRFAADAQRKGKLTEEIGRLTQDIRRIAAGNDLEPFWAELEAADIDALALASQETADELQRVERAHQEAVEAAAVAAEKVNELDGQSRVSELVQQLESDRANLRMAVDRWAPLILAQTLLEDAIARFEREHQPALLRDVGHLFCQMTCGRYVAIRRKLDEHSTILVELADGSFREPGQLSTGTREQLYLAIRLAFAQHYCRESEPLPLVMDDVLANFDDDRAQSTLDVLVTLAEQIQVIFLTCHQDTVDRITSRLPEMKPTRLAVA
jgi:uncharacterized protein YhaN